VLPRYENFPYIEIDKGDHFGIIDIVFRNLQQSKIAEEGKIEEVSLQLKRKFTV